MTVEIKEKIKNNEVKRLKIIIISVMNRAQAPRVTSMNKLIL